jgi:hypothetical protein
MSSKEYREKNKDKIKKQKQDYYEANKEKVKTKAKAYYQANKKRRAECKKEWAEANKDKMNEYKKKYRDTHAGLLWRNQLKHKFGITVEEYYILAKQAGDNCPICGVVFDWKNRHKGNRPCIDHCHKTRKIRGIICGKCNAAIGMLYDDIKMLKKAISWLEK